MLLKDISADRGDALPPKDARYEIWPVFIIFGHERSHVLIETRPGADGRENSLVMPGRLNHADTSFTQGVERLKAHHLGSHCRLQILATISLDVQFHRPAGQKLVLSHYFAEHVDGDFSSGASQFRWTPIDRLQVTTFATERVAEIVQKVRRFPEIAEPQDYLTI